MLRDAGVCDIWDRVFAARLGQHVVDGGEPAELEHDRYRVTLALDWIDGPSEPVASWYRLGARLSSLTWPFGRASPVLVVSVAPADPAKPWSEAEVAAVEDVGLRLRGAPPVVAARPERTAAATAAERVSVAALSMSRPKDSAIVAIATGASSACAREKLIGLVFGPRPPVTGGIQLAAARLWDPGDPLLHGPDAYWIVHQGASGAPTISHTRFRGAPGGPENHFGDPHGDIAYRSAWSPSLDGALVAFEAAPALSEGDLRAELRKSGWRNARYVRDGDLSWWERTIDRGGTALVVCEPLLPRSAFSLRRFAVAFIGRAIRSTEQHH
jgi:hypothetical protein